MNFEPFEIKKTIKKELNSQIRLSSEGSNFPHPGIEVLLYTPEDENKNLYISTFGEDKLQAEIIEHLASRSEIPAQLFIEISYVENTEDEKLVDKGFLLRYISEPPQAKMEVYLEVQKGVANRKQMKLVHPETFIGRCQNVKNRHGGIERVNDLYFADVREIKGRVAKNLQKSEGINNSVSRLHAHIKCVGGSYFLRDDGSSRGTSILIGGRGKSESVDENAGIRLGHDDIISFGKATVKVRIVEKKS